jgi:hypothetical protein
MCSPPHAASNSGGGCAFFDLMQVNPGFRSDNLLTMQVAVNNPDGNQVDSFFKQLQQNVRQLPGVNSVAVSNGLLLLV